MKRLVLILSLAIPVFSVYAQEKTPDISAPWTLQQCIEYALLNNISVKQSELNVQLNDVNYLQSKANILPTLNGNASHQYNFGRTIDPFTNQFATDQVLSQNFFLSSNIVLFSGLQNWNSIQQNKYNLLASKEDLEKMKNDVALNIAAAYLQILFSEELVLNARAQFNITKLQVERTQKLVDAGSLPKSNFLDIQSQSALEELNVVNAENQLTISYLTLAQMLELPDPSGFRIVKPELEVPNVDLVSVSPMQIYQYAVSNMPDVKSSQYKLISAQKGLRIAKGGISPRLTLSGSYGTGYSGASKSVTSVTPTGSWDTTLYFSSSGDFIFLPTFNTQFETTSFADQIDQNLNRSLGFNLSIPLFNGLQTHANIQRSKINLMNAELTLQMTKNNLQKSIQQAYADALAALKKFQASQKAVNAMEESFKFMEQKFNVNMVSSFEYAEAQNRLAKAKSEMLQSKYDYFFKLKVLDYYQGKPLKF
jgi:outer membrane protein